MVKRRGFIAGLLALVGAGRSRPRDPSPLPPISRPKGYAATVDIEPSDVRRMWENAYKSRAKGMSIVRPFPSQPTTEQPGQRSGSVSFPRSGRVSVAGLLVGAGILFAAVEVWPASPGEAIAACDPGTLFSAGRAGIRPTDCLAASAFPSVDPAGAADRIRAGGAEGYGFPSIASPAAPVDAT